ncbi:winged helix-turn-helix transcriptional regulator [Paenibacillus pasadenensis]|uniref:Transcriptional regulator, HxlR family n=1 Tax=Paenibacillus pasadenensis TaxID=217090 RepID=A0A2N5N1T5_9BACL|nr:MULTISPECIES: helix-turn-helix domain-containing protein [Paenibacillus]PLT44300.1 Transcriptional regulator, HxlR family [Paenibacillus pasadenensis]QGG54813.1 transcriptional regulator [Paenibacillus sp. B01]
MSNAETSGLAAKRKPDISPDRCDYTKFLDIVSSKWSALILYALEDGPVRFGEMGRRIEGISKKMQTQTLRQLERDGLVHRELTPLGQSLIGPLRELKRWASAHHGEVVQARDNYDRTLERAD